MDFTSLGLIPLIIIGTITITLLIASTQTIVKYLLAIAHHFSLSESFVGLFILSISTSLPEISVHIMASMGINRGTLDYHIISSTVLGANIGSDIVQQTCILGLVILISGTLIVSKKILKKSYCIMIATTILVLALGLDGKISRIDGLLLVLTFIIYLIYIYKQENKKLTYEKLHYSLPTTIIIIAGALILLCISSSITLSVTESIVIVTGLTGSLIGIISIGIASALPELFTALAAIRKHAYDLSISTLIGSNIVNPLLGIGIGGIISTYYFPQTLIQWDLPVKIITALILFIWLLCNKQKLDYAIAIYSIGTYILYIIIRILYFAID